MPTLNVIVTINPTTHRQICKNPVCFCTFVTIGAIVIWQVSMETAAGDCWVTVMGKAIVSTWHLQCRTWTGTQQKTLGCYDDDGDDEKCANAPGGRSPHATVDHKHHLPRAAPIGRRRWRFLKRRKLLTGDHCQRWSGESSERERTSFSSYRRRSRLHFPLISVSQSFNHPSSVIGQSSHMVLTPWVTCSSWLHHTPRNLRPRSATNYQICSAQTITSFLDIWCWLYFNQPNHSYKGTKS